MTVWRYCTEIFDYLSLSAIIDGKVGWLWISSGGVEVDLWASTSLPLILLFLVDLLCAWRSFPFHPDLGSDPDD